MTDKGKDNLTEADEFALVDRYHLEPQLFQVLPRGRRQSRPVEIKCDLSSGGSLEIAALHHLQPIDAVLMCLICCKAAQDKLYIHADTQSSEGRRLRMDLDLRKDAAQDSCLAYRTSARNLINQLGLKWHGNKSVKKIEDSIKRMFRTSFVLERFADGRRRVHMCNLLASVDIEDTGRDAEMLIAINPILAAAIIDPGHYAHVGMDDLRKLAGKEAQQLLYVLLCNMVSSGSRKYFRPQDIRTMLYGPPEEGARKNTTNQQTSRAMRALRDMADTVGWMVSDRDGRVCVSRPHRVRRPIG